VKGIDGGSIGTDKIPFMGLLGHERV